MAGVEHNLASTLISLQLGRHESSIERLLHHSSQLMEVIQHQRKVMRGQSVAPPPDLTLRYNELVLRQESLTSQIMAERELPPLVAGGMKVRDTINNWIMKVNTSTGGSARRRYNNYYE